MKQIIRWAAAAALVLAPAGASAESLWLYQGNPLEPQTIGQFYFGPSFRGGVQQLPRFKSPITFFTTTNGPFSGTVNFDPDVRGTEPGAMIGYVFRDGTVPPWVGQRFRIEVSGNAIAFSGTSTESNQRPSTNGIFVAGVGGPAHFNGNLGSNTQFVDTLKIHREGFTVALQASADHTLGPNLVLTPSVGVFGGRIVDTFEYLNDAIFAGGTHRPHPVDEKVRTTEFGGRIGAAVTWRFHSAFALNFGGDVGLVWMRSRMTGLDCNAGIVALGVNCGPGAGVTITSVSDSRSTVGFRGGAKLGLTADLRFAQATIGGFFRYDSRIPGVDNPQVLVQTAGVTTNSPARVSFSGGFAYGGFINIRIPLVGL